MRIVRVLVSITLGVLLLLPAAYAQCPTPGSLTYALSLNGSQFGGQGSANAFGNGYLTINPQTGQATVNLNTTGLSPNVTGAGLFQSGTNGGTSSLAFPFYSASNNSSGTAIGFQNGSFQQTSTLSQTLINQILANPSAYSFQIATGEYPNGAVTATLTPMQTFGGTLSGSSVIGSNGSGNAGATNGGGAFTAEIGRNASGTGNVLNYSFTPTGIGTTFTGLTLNQGGVGSNGTNFLTLSNGGTLQNGRFTGSVALTDAQTQQFLANPGNFYVSANTTQFANGAVRAQVAGVQNEYWVPVAGAVRGMFGNQWQTDVQIYNASSGTPATVTVQTFPAGQANASAAGTMNATNASALTIQPRATNALTNVTQSLFTNLNGLSALRIISDQPVVVVERIYDASTSGGASNNRAATAQAIPALTRCEAVARGILAAVSGSGSSGNSQLALRTNIGFFNPNATPVTVQMNLANNGGSAVGTQQTLTLQPFSLTQMPMLGSGGMFTSASDVNNGALTFNASAPIFAYSSITDNASGDTHVMFAKQDVSIAAIAESDIAGIVTTANQGEVQQAQAAAPRLNATAAIAFAQQMITEHTAALAQAQTVFTQLGIAPAQNATTAFLQAQTQQIVATLNATPAGSSSDRAYIQSQVVAHQMVLSMIDQILLPSARTAQMMTLLQVQRAQVAAHLTQAQQILQSLP